MHITVSIPVFNRAHLIGRTIESVLTQAFADFDLMIVDDASQDNTVKVAGRYCEQDARIQVVVNAQNLGLTRNWNRCLELARGPLVQLLLSDDLIDPDYLQLVSDVFEQHPSVGIVASSCRYIDEADRVIDPGKPIADQLFAAGDEAVSALVSGGYPHVSSVVFRRQCYEKLGMYFTEIWHGPDVEMDARIASKYDYYRFGGVHTSFRRHGSNMGNLEYLRDDFLEVDWLKRRRTLEYLSLAARERLGILDLDGYLAAIEAQVALLGAISSVTYGRPRLSRRYVRKALEYDSRSWRTLLFWKAALLNVWPALGRRVMQKRLGLRNVDREAAVAVETSLHHLGGRSPSASMFNRDQA